MFDTLITGGEIIDGTGAPGFKGDVGISGDRVVAIGQLHGAAAARRIDATGLTVSPGFVDLHTHSDFTLLTDGRADSQICQGVTTEAIGQCGVSCSLSKGSSMNTSPDGTDSGSRITWNSFGEYLERLQEARPAVNVAAFVGHGAIHAAVKGDSLATSTESDIAAMVRIAESAFDDGAFGFSTGLEYWPGNSAPFEEIAALTAVSAKRGGLYASHVRNRDVYYDLGFTEAVATARHAGARLQISHIQPKFGAPAQAMQHSLELLYRAEREGVDVAFDVIPHDWSHTSVVAVLPAWARDGGTAKTLERLRNPELRERMKNNPKPIWRLVTARQWDEIVLMRSVANPTMVGLSLTEIGKLRGVDPYDAVFDLLVEEGQNMNGMFWTSRSFNDKDVCMCMRESKCSVMSDTVALSRRGPLKDTMGSLSGYGWTARFLGHYVRDRGVLPLSEAVRRISSQPAQRLGLIDRGLLRAGSFADVVVFDPQKVQDHTSVRSPLNHPSGFIHVMVNGSLVVADGARNDECPGRVLRNTG